MNKGQGAQHQTLHTLRRRHTLFTQPSTRFDCTTAAATGTTCTLIAVLPAFRIHHNVTVRS
jgi:hypothetical protein